MTPKEALNSIKEIFIHNEYGESRGSTYDIGITLCENIEQALTELEELKQNSVIISNEDAERYLNVFERNVLTLISKKISDEKNSLDKQLEELK